MSNQIALPARPIAGSMLLTISRALQDVRGISIDRLAIGLSGLCLVHCIGTAVLLATMASVGGVLVSHEVHEIGLMLAISFAVIGLLRGVFTHGLLAPFVTGCFGLGLMTGALARTHDGVEIAATMIGVTVVALGHHMNLRAAR